MAATIVIPAVASRLPERTPSRRHEPASTDTQEQAHIFEGAGFDTTHLKLADVNRFDSGIVVHVYVPK
jgi:hypothetical protein